MTQCFGCWTQCGVRVRVDTEQGQSAAHCGQPLSSVVARAPYRRLCPLCHGNGTVDRESGLDARSTACARGATLLEGLYSPLRILEPMKRVGKRGEGKMAAHQLRTADQRGGEGGDLFGEGHVDGLRAIHDPLHRFLMRNIPALAQNPINCWSPIPAMKDVIPFYVASH